MPGQYFGKYTGIVKDNRDDQKLGQVKVSVPAIFPADELMVARAALPYGFFFVPEQEAKVWVEFEGGDPGLPLWTGIQYVAGEWAEEAKANPPQKRVIKTASGHIIIFDDVSGEESIHIEDGAHHHTIILDKNGITIQSPKDGSDPHTITFTNDGITLQSPGDLVIKGQNIRVEAQADVTIKGQNITIQAQSNLTAQGQATSVEAQAKLTVKGNPIHLNP